MSASLKSEIPGGGIRSQHVESDFADYVAGRATSQRVVLAVVQTNSVSSENQTKGRVNKVKYEVVHLVEVRDQHEADQLRHRITQLRADQGLEVSQPALFGLTEAEQCEELIEQIKEWASAQDIPIGEVDQRFYSYFGGGEAPPGLAKTVQACRSPLQLKEFAYEVGAIADPKPTDSEGDEEPDPDVEDEAGEEPSSTSAVASVPFKDVTE